MRKLFGPDTSLTDFLNRAADLVFLNIITLLCCLPVITAGAAITALYDTAARLQRGEARLYSGFFKAFGTNFLRATGLWLILLILGAFLVYCLFFYLSGSVFMLLIAVLAVLFWAMAVSWAFPLMAWFRWKPFRCLKTAVLCGIAYLPRTAVAVALNLLPAVLFLLAPNGFWSFGMIWVFLYFSLIACFNQALMHKAFVALSQEEA